MVVNNYFEQSQMRLLPDMPGRIEQHSKRKSNRFEKRFSHFFSRKFLVSFSYGIVLARLAPKRFSHVDIKVDIKPFADKYL